MVSLIHRKELELTWAISFQVKPGGPALNGNQECIE